jgi:hypothetical protein
VPTEEIFLQVIQALNPFLFLVAPCHFPVQLLIGL